MYIINIAAFGAVRFSQSTAVHPEAQAEMWSYCYKLEPWHQTSCTPKSCTLNWPKGCEMARSSQYGCQNYLFSNSEISACNLRCHFSACINTCLRSRMFVWAVLISSDSTSPWTTVRNPSNISSTSSTVNVSSVNLERNKNILQLRIIHWRGWGLWIKMSKKYRKKFREH